LREYIGGHKEGIGLFIAIVSFPFGGLFVEDIRAKFDEFRTDYVRKCNELATDPDDINRGSDVGIEQNDIKIEAKDICKRASDKANPQPLQSRLKHQYARTLEASREFSEAERIYRQLASHGYVPSQARLGAMLVEVSGRPQEGIYYLEKASKDSSVVAKYHLGRACLKGRGIEENWERGIKLLTEAEAGGSISAHVFLEVAKSQR
jgi:TPR repeat protein